MIGPNSNNFLVFGLEHSGKTTFAAALWHLVDSREIPSTALVKGKHDGNFRYLEKIAQLWCEGWKVERTKSEEIEDVRINLIHAKSGAEIVLEFTDLAGENLEKAFATRFCPPKFVEIVKRSRGMLLFVNADRKIDDVTILDALSVLGPSEEQSTDIASAATAADTSTVGLAGENEKAKKKEDVPWDPADTPAQVRLVDLLQSLRLPPFGQPPFKIAVIVSAWDLAEEESAELWLSKKLPLLDQFLKNREIATEVRTYGVSAQGGPLPKKGLPATEDRTRLLEITPASKRIKVVGHGASEHDLTHPILWLSGLDKLN
jgi:hypothetical protein